MKITRHLLASLVIAAGVTSTWAQQAPAAPASAAATQDCGKGGMAPHNHGAERNTGGMAKKGCPGMDASAKKAAAAQLAASAPKAKTSMAHDHAKFHKNQ